MPRWVRRCLTVACLLAAWLVARPASAAAPLCDERGASMLAPLPVLDAPNASLDVGERGDACDGEASHDKAYHRGEGSHRAPPCSHVDVDLARGNAVMPPLHRDASPSPLLGVAPRAGVRSKLERPPRSAKL